MGVFINASDFTQGKFQLHVGTYSQQNLTDYIQKYELRYVYELLGSDLADEFLTDISVGGGVPTEQRFINIFYPFTEDYMWTINMSDGMTEMLKGFLYYEYQKDQIVQMTPVGVVVPSGENSRDNNTLYTQLYTRYNDAIRTYKAIQQRIINNSTDYSEFNGKRKMMMNWL